MEVKEFGDGTSATFALSISELPELSIQDDSQYRLTYIGERGNRRMITESEELPAGQRKLVELLHRNGDGAY